MLLFVFILAATINRRQANEGLRLQEEDAALNEPLITGTTLNCWMISEWLAQEAQYGSKLQV